MKNLTKDQTQALDSEYQELFDQVRRQTEEQVRFLIIAICEDVNLGSETKARLVGTLENNGFVVKAFRVTAANATEKPQIQVMYDIDDDLYAYLKRDNIPARLKTFLDEGVEIKSKDTAEDLMPKTGKTKVP